MTRPLALLILAQFLSAFADNAVLFTVISLALREGEPPSWYIPLLQSVFILAYIVLTPWVGALADQHQKPRILLVANGIKGLGAALIATGLEPLIGYAVIGIGAALYGPAKYGIIPELSSRSRLVKANGWVEGSTIAAILIGTVGGARLADDSISLALTLVISFYGISGLSTLWLPRGIPTKSSAGFRALSELSGSLKLLWQDKRPRLIVTALSLFWALAATLRVILVAWAPAVLHAETASQIADLTFFMAMGIVFGAALAPRLIPIDRVRRTRFAAYLLAMLLTLMANVTGLWEAKAVLFGIGILGGILVVPLNAAIQELGHQSIGSGRAVAAQNFFQNTAILVGMGIYGGAATLGLPPAPAIALLGGLTLLLTVVIERSLPPIQAPSDPRR